MSAMLLPAREREADSFEAHLDRAANPPHVLWRGRADGAKVTSLARRFHLRLVDAERLARAALDGLAR